MKTFRLVDTTFRDGHASLWAERMRTDMMLAVAADMDRAGFAAMEVIATSHFKKCVRELGEDPWERIRLLSARIRSTPLAAMSGPHAPAGFGVAPRALTALWMERLAAAGIRRVQIMEASNDMVRVEPAVAAAHAAGLQVFVVLMYSLSPRHTDAYYARKSAEAAALRPGGVVLEDPAGLLTVERVRTLLPAVLAGLGGTPLEFHAHCCTGLAPLCYLEALKAGAGTVHTAVPPLADGPSQPSVFNVVRNARTLGFAPWVDEGPLVRASEHLRAFADREGLPVGRPVEYDHAQYVHQVPGGVISNLRHQLAQMRMSDRLPEILDESVRVRRDLGYPIMVTPFSQFVVSQATINVFLGERYREVADEVIRYALGHFGEEASAGVDPGVHERILGRPRARELAAWEPPDPPLEEVRRSLGGAGLADDELLLRYVVGSERDIAAMRAAGPPRQDPGPGSPLLALLRGLRAHRDVRRIAVQKPGFSLVLERGSALPGPPSSGRALQKCTVCKAVSPPHPAEASAGPSSPGAPGDGAGSLSEDGEGRRGAA